MNPIPQRTSDVVAPPPWESKGSETEELVGGCPPTPCSDLSSFSCERAPLLITIQTTTRGGLGKTLMQIKLAETLEAAGFPVTISDYGGTDWDAAGYIKKCGERALTEADSMNVVPVHLHVSNEVAQLSQGTLGPMPRRFRSAGLRTSEVVAPPPMESEGAVNEELKGGCSPTPCSDSSSSLERIHARSAARRSEQEESALARTISGIKESHEEKIEAIELLSRLCAGLPVRERNLIRTLIR